MSRRSNRFLCFHRKFEEIYPPDVGEFVFITDDTYTTKQVLRMEHLILKALNFNVAVPTSNQFLKRYLRAAKADKKAEFLAQVRVLFYASFLFIFESFSRFLK